MKNKNMKKDISKIKSYVKRILNSLHSFFFDSGIKEKHSVRRQISNEYRDLIQMIMMPISRHDKEEIIFFLPRKIQKRVSGKSQHPV